MVLISLTGLLTLTVAVYGNFFGSSFPSMSNFQTFPSFPSSSFSSNDVFSSQPSFSGFNSFPAFGSSNDFGAQQSFGSFPQGSSSGNNVHQTIKLEKNGPNGSKITETIETLGGPGTGSSVKVNRQSSSSSSSSSKDGNPVKVVHFYGANGPTSSPSSSQGIAVGEPNPSAPIDQDTEFSNQNSQTSDDFPSFNDFSNSFSNFNDNFYPSSAGISTAATSSSNSNFVTSSSSKTLPDGSTITETVTYDSNNPGKVTRVIKRIDANGKVTTTTV